MVTAQPSVPGSGNDAVSTVNSVEHGDLRLGFLPGVGGRLISVRHRGRELLFQRPGLRDLDLDRLPPETDMASWWNLGGSKTWPAPQEVWGGPPDPVLDGGRFSFARTAPPGGGTTITMVGPPDQATGLEITRRFDIGPRAGGFDQLITFRNVLKRSITWAPWEVCQVDTSHAADGQRGSSVVRVDVGIDDVVDLGRYVGHPDLTTTSDGVQVPVAAVVAKWGFTQTPSSISIRCPDVTLSLGFDVAAGASYPDGGCAAELWMQHPTAAPIDSLDGWQPDAWLVELEVLGPLVTLAPGETTELAIRWDVTPTC